MRNRYILTLFLILFTLFAEGQNCGTVRYLEEVFPDVTVTSGISFGEADPYGILPSQELFLDFYEPTGDVLEKRPVIIYAFGGGFLIGTRFQPPIPQFCEHFARLGYVVAAIDYRIGFTTTSSESAERAVYRGVQDVRAAMRYLAEFSGDLGIDTTNIFLTGSSAGCFSAFHSTFMEESDRPQSSYGTLLEPEDMGCANCSGNAWLDNREIRPKGIINNWGAILDTNFIDPTAMDNVPVISFHGTDDLAVPYNSGSPFSYPIFPTVHGSAPIHERLDNLGIVNQLVPLVGIGHEPWLLDASLLDTVYRYSAPFLYEIMRPATSSIAGDALVPMGAVRTYTVVGEVDSEFCWEVTGGVIVNENGGTVDVLWNALGTWEVRVTELSCIEVLGDAQVIEVEVVEPTSVPDSDVSEQMVYPNPTGGMVVLLLPDGLGADAEMRVLNAQGQVMWSESVGAGHKDATVDMAAYAAGTYTIVLLKDGQRKGHWRVAVVGQ